MLSALQADCSNISAALITIMSADGCHCYNGVCGIPLRPTAYYIDDHLLVHPRGAVGRCRVTGCLSHVLEQFVRPVIRNSCCYIYETSISVYSPGCCCL